MSEKQVVMKFELLPNEILIECFEYLNSPDIFYSFDQLNYRFYKLIQTIPLHFNCEYIRKSTFDQFCTKILLTPEIKTQFRSIHLSNKNRYVSIKTFLSFFSLDQFSHLRSMTLTGVKKDEVEQLKSILSLIPELTCFRLLDSGHYTKDLLSVVPMSKLRTLSVQTIDSYLISTHEILPIKNLIISDYSLDNFSYLFRRVPMLQYLNIQYISKIHLPLYGNNIFTGDYAVYLKQLTINNFNRQFNDLITLLQQTPNLKRLIISTFNNSDMIDAYRWEHLITSSLPQLTIFKFHFRIYPSDNILDKFQKFQSEFWQEQHHWFVEYKLHKDLADIYTIPYISNTFIIRPHTNRYCNESINNANIFDNVSDLILCKGALTLNDSYYFPNVTSLSLGETIYFEDIEDDCLKIEHIDVLKMIFNLFNLRYLIISSSCKIESSSVLLQLLKETPQLLSIDIGPQHLQLFFNNNELCKYLNKLITRLSVFRNSYDLLNDSHQLEKFCKIFSNLEQLICHINRDSDLLFLLTHLSKLSMMKILLPVSFNRERFTPWLKDEAEKLNLTIYIDLDDPLFITLYLKQ
jgi:hypothetical protein